MVPDVFRKKIKKKFYVKKYLLDDKIFDCSRVDFIA